MTVKRSWNTLDDLKTRLCPGKTCGATETRTPDLLHAMQVRRRVCQRHHRLLPADLVHRRACECLPVAGCWLSTWLSTIRLGTTCSNAVGETLTHAPAWRRHTDPLR